MIPDDVKKFFDKHIIGREDMVLTVKSIDPALNNGVSVNIDGPFKYGRFVFEGAGEFDVLENVDVKTRKGSKESEVHAHIPWGNVKYVRLAPVNLKTIPHDMRIILYYSVPPANDRGAELIWFYTYKKNHPDLLAQMPIGTSGFSQTKEIGDVK